MSVCFVLTKLLSLSDQPLKPGVNARPRKQSRELPRQAAFMAFGGVILLPLAGVLADIGWRVPFLVYTVALVLLPAMIFALPEPDRREPTGDRPTSISALRQTLARLPLRTLALIFVLGLVSQTLFYMIPVLGPFYLKSQVGVSAALIGGAIATSTFASGIVSMLYGRIRSSTGVVAIITLTFALMSIGFIVIGINQTLLGVLSGLAVVGAGVGLILPNLNTWIAAVTPETVRGQALSGLTSAVFLGQFLSPIVMRPVSSTVGLSTTFLGVGVVLAGGAILSILAMLYRTSPTEFKSDEQSAD